MSNTGYSSIIMIKPETGAPECWYWDINRIKEYICQQRQHARAAYSSLQSGNAPKFNSVVDNNLLNCFSRDTPDAYSFDVNGDPITIYVPFHYRTQDEFEVPISDVYGALGWFLSYSDAQNLNEDQKIHLLICYTRLCNIIGDSILAMRHQDVPRKMRDRSVFLPVMTHILWQSSIPVISSGLEGIRAGHGTERTSISASLPWTTRRNHRDPRSRGPKQDARGPRFQLIMDLVGPEVVDRMSELQKDHIGICAESLTFASFYKHGKRMHGLGQAMECKKVPKQFASYSSIRETAFRAPCAACAELFAVGGVTMYDTASGIAYGPTLPNTRLLPNWEGRLSSIVSRIDVETHNLSRYSQNASFPSLPWDVHFLILAQPGHQYIVYLRIVYPHLTDAISNDKNLWSHVFKRELKKRSLPIPSNLRSISEVEGADIESWVKHIHVLDGVFDALDKELSIHNVRIHPELRVTWLKLIFGQWCLIAGSNDDKSELSLWRISSDSEIRRVALVYLDAPVIDGQIDCSDSTVSCAITVGATKPYIKILGLYQSEVDARIQQLAEIRDASHVQFFRAEYVGFSVCRGDDTFPHLSNWQTGRSYCLRFWHDNPEIDCPLPTEPSIALTARNGLIFSLHITAIHIFSFPQSVTDVEATAPKHLVTLPLHFRATSGYFLDEAFKESNSGQKSPICIHVFYQRYDSLLQQVTLTLHRENGRDLSFSVTEVKVKTATDIPSLRCIYFMSPGSSGRRLLYVTSPVLRNSMYNHSVFVTPMQFNVGQDSGRSLCDQLDGPRLFDGHSPVLSHADQTTSSSSTNDQHGGASSLSDECSAIPISSSNFSSLHLLSCVDFDDWSGILLMGTTSGEIRLASFLPEVCMTPKGTRSMLSAVDWLKESTSNLSEAPVFLDLPLFYRLRKRYRIFHELPEDVIIQATSDWRDPRIGLITIGGWSNDWSKFEDIWHWIFPFSRWGPLDTDFHDEINGVFFRYRLQTLGEIVPILYHTSNQQEILFRIGQRIFYSDPEQDDINEQGCLGVLPLTYDQFLNDPDAILPLLSDHGLRSNLRSREAPFALTMRMSLAGCSD
ncbi:hypothetical protein ACEPAF_46 [Sanghuangporus sanghuang]